MALDAPSPPEPERSLLQILQQTNISRIINLVLSFLVFGIVLFILIRDSPQLISISLHLNVFLFVLSFLVADFGLLIAIIIWRQIISRNGAQHSLRDDIRIYSYSNLAMLIPGGIWSILSRSSHYQRLGEKSLNTVLASLVETLLIGIAALGVYSITTLIYPEYSLFNSQVLTLSLAIIALILLNPWVFNRLIKWILLKIRHSTDVTITIYFHVRELALWLVLEMVVVLIGGVAVFTLLASLTPVTVNNLIPSIVAWSAANSAGYLFFWLPAKFILRDGALVVVMAKNLSLPIAMMFVIIFRFWSISSILIFAGIVWLVLDLPLIINKKGD